MNRIPTYDDFKRGLSSGHLQDIDVDVLQALLQAPGHALTATELAQALGSETGHDYGNLRIGRLGSNLAAAMSFTPNRRDSDGTYMYWNVVAAGHHRDADEHFVFTMHDDLVAALQQFPASTRTGRPVLTRTPADELPELTDEQRSRVAARRAQRRRDR